MSRKEHFRIKWDLYDNNGDFYVGDQISLPLCISPADAKEIATYIKKYHGFPSLANGDFAAGNYIVISPAEEELHYLEDHFSPCNNINGEISSVDGGNAYRRLIRL